MRKQNQNKQSGGTRRVGFGMVCLAVLLVAALTAGVAVTTLGVKATLDRERTPAQPTLTTTIAKQTLRHTVTGTLETIAHDVFSVPGEGMVTRDGLAAGNEIGEGGVIGYIEERPVLLLQGDIPAYRTLTPGVNGQDVTQLQNALKRLGYAIYDREGSYGDSTALALFRFLRQLGFASVDASGNELSVADWKQSALPQGQVVFAPSMPLLAQTTCGASGQRVQGELCHLESRARDYVVTFSKADVTDAAALKGKEVTILLDAPCTGVLGDAYVAPADASNANGTNDANAIDGAVSSSSTNQSMAADSGTNSDRMTIRLEQVDANALPANPSGTRVSVVLGASAEDALVVASVALRSDEKSSWVQRTDGGRVDVELGFCYQGQCEISGTGITEGMTVEVPSNNALQTAEGKQSHE